jgi:hypothetical protein
VSAWGSSGVKVGYASRALPEDQNTPAGDMASGGVWSATLRLAGSDLT